MPYARTIQHLRNTLFLSVLLLSFSLSSIAFAQLPTAAKKKPDVRKVAMTNNKAKEPVMYAKNPDFQPSTNDDDQPSVSKKTKPSSDAPYRLKVEASTNAPLDIGGRVTLELPFRFRIMGTLGFMPTFYSNLINLVATRANLYDATTGAIVKSSLNNSLVWRVHGEFRPLPSAGFFLGGGYGQIRLSGQVNGASVAGMSTNLGVPASYLTGINYQLNSTLHMLSGEIGYEFSFLQNVMTLRIAVGLTGTIASNTKVQAQIASTVPAQIATYAVQAGQQAAAKFDTMYRDSVFSPTLSIGMGFRLF